MKSIMRLGFVLFALVLAGCVNVDPETEKTIPRGGQKNKFAVVEEKAEQLRDGMTKIEVITLLGSPAETSNGGDIWVYLPERPAVLVPSHALRLVFQNNILMSHSSPVIIVGQKL